MRDDLPAHVHDAVVQTGSAADRRTVAARCSGTLARRLLDDDDSGVRRAAASNPNLAGAARLALERGDLAVLTAVIDRDDVPVGLTRELCLAVLRHPERNLFEAASAVRRHPGLEATVLASLLADPVLDATVAAAALGNAAAPADVVLQHVIDPDPHVRCAALQAVLDRALPITEEALQAAEITPTVPRPLGTGVVGLEAPVDCVAPLVAALRKRGGAEHRF